MKEITKTDNNDEDIYKWFVLASFCLNSRMCNIFMFTGISPIWSMVAIYYNTTDYNLNWLSNMYYLPLITLTFLFNPFINKYFGISQILSCCFTSLGLWLLFIVKHDFTLCCLSYTLIGIGESLYFQVPLHLSKIWFPNSERIVSTFIGQYASNVGMLIAYLVSTIYFFEITDETEFNYRYENLIFYNALFSTIALVFNFSTLRKPKLNLTNLQIRDNFLDSYKKICLAEEALIDFLSVSAFIGLSWCYTLLFGTQQYLIGQTYIEVTQTSIIFQLGQIITGGFCTWKLQNYSKNGMQLNFDAYIKGTIAIGFLALVFQILFFETIPISILYIINFLIGVGLGGSYCVLLESLTEKHYPIQELTIGTGLAAGASIISFVITMILVIPKFLEFGFQISCYLMILPFCYISVFYQTQFKRFEVEA